MKGKQQKMVLLPKVTDALTETNEIIRPVAAGEGFGGARLEIEGAKIYRRWAIWVKCVTKGGSWGQKEFDFQR